MGNPPTKRGAKGKPTPPPGKTRQQDPSALTNGLKAFVEAYLANGCNGARAYRETHPRANAQTSRVEACRILTIPSVRAAVDAGLAEKHKRWAMQGDEAIALLSARARANLAHVPRDQDGNMLPLEEWPDDLQVAVKEITDDGGVKLYDGLKAAELMAMATGRLRSKLDVNHTFNHLDLLAGSETPPEED